MMYLSQPKFRRPNLILFECPNSVTHLCVSVEGFCMAPKKVAPAAAAEAPLNPQLNKVMQRRTELEAQIAELDEQIYSLETAYVLGSADVGGLVDAWGTNATRDRKRAVSDSERIFSLTSATALPTVEARLRRPK